MTNSWSVCCLLWRG